MIREGTIRRRRSQRRHSLRWTLASATALTLVAAVGVGGTTVESRDSVSYQQQHQALVAQLKQATQQGYTRPELAPITSSLARLDGTGWPQWMPIGPGFPFGRAVEVARLQSQLRSLEARMAHQAGPDDTEAIQQAAQQLVAQTGGNLAAIQQAGQQALTNGRNDASVAGYLEQGGMINGFKALQHDNDRLEAFAGLVGSTNLKQVAQGAAAAERYAGEIHQGLMAGLPAQTVIVSFQAQHAWAYQGSQVVMDTPVTTGLRSASDGFGASGDPNWGTDFGPMKVVQKDSPWVFRSPWPASSPHWYPDTQVQWATFFTSTGEAFHDASWEPDEDLGPGSQYSAGVQSHGCIHLPADMAQWMFNWAQTGTAVIVYPGDGTPAATQLAQITTNNQGVPDSAA